MFRSAGALRVALALALLASLVSCARNDRQPHQGGAGLRSSKIHQLVFNLVKGANLQPSITADPLIAAMKKRLDIAQIRADVFTSTDRRIRVTIYDSSNVLYATKLLSTRGQVSLRIFPRGPEYRSPSGQPFSGAKLDYDVTGEPIAIFTSSDPRSMAQFTTKYVNRRLGYYFDERLIQAYTIEGPISDQFEVHGFHLRARDLLFIVAVVESGPLPARVKLVSSSVISST